MAEREFAVWLRVPIRGNLRGSGRSFAATMPVQVPLALDFAPSTILGWSFAPAL